VVEIRGNKVGKKLMKILLLLLALTVFYLGAKAYALTFEDQFHERLMEVGWKQSLLELDRYSSNERRYILGRALQAFGSDQIPRDPARQESLEMAQSALLAIPGHAKYYQDKIESLRAEVLANAKIPEEVARMQQEGKQPIHGGDYNDFRKQAFRVLGLLPSSETVAVLGYFLNDPESRDGRNMKGELIPRNDVQPYPPNCGAAYIAIANLGIENPPGGPKPDRRLYDYQLDQVDAWKDWWNEIKAGKRTYRFIGSKIEYGPDGPASKEAIQRSERNRKRDEERAGGHRKSSSAPDTNSVVAQVTKPLSIAGILVALTLVTGAVWYFLRGRRVA
jgi:hypothetical protein